MVGRQVLFRALVLICLLDLAEEPVGSNSIGHLASTAALSQSLSRMPVGSAIQVKDHLIYALDNGYIGKGPMPSFRDGNQGFLDLLRDSDERCA